MDNFDLKPEPKVKKKQNPILLDILSVIILLAACYLAYIFMTIFINPNSSLNPVPPPSLPTLYQTPTFTTTLIPQPPTWTPTLTIQPSPTRTKAPTWTPISAMVTPTFTETPLPATIEGTEIITNTPSPATAEISYEASTVMHADSECNWLGIGGKVLDADGAPVQFQTVQVGGALEDKVVNQMALSGTAPAYGTSGFEFVLADHPIASEQDLWIQLFDNNGQMLTDKMYFDTYDDCDQNLVMVVFTKNK
jgi:hypothetical protein